VKQRLLALLPALVGIALFAAAAWVLRGKLSEHHLDDVVAHVASIPAGRIGLAALLAVAGYVSLTGYDALALRWVGATIRYPRVALASFIAYVFSHNVGLSFFGGSAVRYRMFTSWGVDTAQLARAIAFNVLTFWLGFLTLGGVVFAISPLPVPGAWHPAIATTRPVGVLFLGLVALYAAATLRPRRSLRIRGFEIEQPGPGWTAAQAILSCVDWALAAATLFVLLPAAPGLGFATVLGAFLLAQVIGLVSHVPAGLGVFETAMVLLLAPWLSSAQVLGSVLAFRVLYYLVPMALAVALFVGFEALQRRDAVRSARAFLSQWAPELVPRALAVAVFAAGVVLLVSGATPAADGRVETLGDWLPLPLLELSHLLGSGVGVALLLLARAMQQRIDAAYWFGLALLLAGAAASLGKGLDWEEAVLLLAVAAALVPCRRFFYRRSSLLGQSFSSVWIAGIAGVLLATGIVVALAYRHVEYAHELWWQFALDAHAPRSLRALAAGALLLGGFALARLLRPAPPPPSLPDPAELDRAAAIADASPRAGAFLALLGDKELLFHTGGEGFVMYGVSGRAWVAMGDPVASDAAVRRELAWRFREEADRHGGTPVFYEVGGDDLPIYVDLGLQLRKIGEEARVALPDFSIEGKTHAKLRHAVRRMEREGVRFEMVPVAGVPPLLDELQAVSDQWLAEKSTREKRFSLGFLTAPTSRACPWR